MKFKLLAMVAVCGVFTAGCKTEAVDGSGGGGTGGGGTGGSGNVTVANSTGTGGGDTIPACYDEGAALQAPDMQTVTNQNVCTATQLTDLATACFEMGATMATCDAWEAIAGNPECAACVFGTDVAGTMASGNSPVIEFISDTSAIVNFIACEAAATGLPQCGPPLAELIVCVFSVCAECDAADDDACLTYGESADSICGDIVIPTECNAVGTGTPSAQCDGADFDEYYANIGIYFCGP